MEVQLAATTLRPACFQICSSSNFDGNPSRYFVISFKCVIRACYQLEFRAGYFKSLPLAVGMKSLIMGLIHSYFPTFSRQIASDPQVESVPNSNNLFRSGQAINNSHFASFRDHFTPDPSTSLT
jgi:hypothetical protein